ncbi:hypothetical protein Celaphus_00006268, partial [Cervus elaphus hippelaphus]
CIVRAPRRVGNPAEPADQYLIPDVSLGRRPPWGISAAKVFNSRVVCPAGSLFPLPSTHISRNHVLEMNPGDRSSCTSKRSLIGSTLTR